ncbi:MAG: hypothetical protein LC734_09960, partial [Acidobacteria bacterium]|nr:hypothetical protein [Acidobacteriota bacterium]
RRSRKLRRSCWNRVVPIRRFGLKGSLPVGKNKSVSLLFTVCVAAAVGLGVGYLVDLVLDWFFVIFGLLVK